MNELVQVGDGVFGWVLQTSWQAGILALLILFAQVIFRRRLSPAWRYGLWLLLVARLLLPNTPQTSWSIYNFANLPAALNKAEGPLQEESSAVPVLLPTAPSKHKVESELAIVSERRTSKGSPNASTTRNETATGQEKLSWHRLGLLTWIVGVCLFATRLFWSNFRFLHRINDAPNVTSGPSVLLLRACQDSLGVAQPVELVETEAVQSPSVHGLWRKRMLLPEGSLKRFSTDELRCIFLHELAHIKRHDLEVNWLCSLLLVVHWFNPLLWLAFARMRHDREIACDAVALTKLGKSLAEPYGETIIKVVGSLLNPTRSPGVLALSEDRERLKERIRMIAGFRHWPRWSALAVVLASGIAAVGLTNASRARPATAPIQEIVTSTISSKQDVVALPRGIHARVVDFQDNPVTNANVECLGFGWRKTTDSQGRFSWNGEEQSRTFLIRKSGFKTLLTDLLNPSESETILRLQRAPAIGGKVIDAETHQPVSAFQVHHIRLLQGPVTPSLMSPREVVTGSFGAFEYSFDWFFGPDSAFYIDAEGYRPTLSRPLSDSDDGKELMFELTRAQPVGGIVMTPQGVPAEKAEIRLWCGELNISGIANRHTTESDMNGAFSVPTILDGKVLVYHNSGYAETPWKDFLAKRLVQLVEWGHVKGHWPKPLPKSGRVSLERINWAGRRNSYTFPPPWDVSSAEVKANGDFQFEEGAAPGEYMLTEWNNLKLDWPGGGYSRALLLSRRLSLLVEPGRTTVVEVPAGRSVVGKVIAGDEQSLTNVHFPVVSLTLKQNGPELDFPALDSSASQAENLKRWTDYRERVLKFWLSVEGKARRRAERVFEVPTERDGTFRIDNVPPGDYTLQANAERWGGKPGSVIRQEISISSSTDGTPVDLGTLK